VLYPSDATPAGQELRLRQEYFFVSASSAGPYSPAYQDIRSYQFAGRQDCHPAQRHAPAIGVAELMRILLDVHQIPWEELADDPGDFSYNQPHFAAGSAGELAGAADGTSAAAPHADHLPAQRAASGPGCGRQFPGDEALLSSVSMIDEHQGRRVRMSHLAFLGSHRIKRRLRAAHRLDAGRRCFNDLHNMFPSASST